MLVVRRGGGGAAAAAAARSMNAGRAGVVGGGGGRFWLSTPAKPADPPKDGDDEDAISPIAARRQELKEYDRHLVWGKTGEFMPAPILPENPQEIAALDPADIEHRTKMDGTPRRVMIRQQEKKPRQSPLNPESSWRIFFYEDGMITEKWNNSLMGWVSNADPYQCAPPLTFRNAAEAVYFCKKRGWEFEVQHPILRYTRDDDAQYQDNFLPQVVAAKVQQEKTSCDHWHRTAAGTSHYFRPLKYHGDGLVAQHGPTGNAPIAPHVEGTYKMR